MKRLVYFLAVLITGLTGCTRTISSIDQVQPKQAYPSQAQKSPMAITLVDHPEKLASHYIVIGEATVSKYNVAGIKRQKAIIKDRLLELAASMGGDAIFNLKNNGKYVTATVMRSAPVKPFPTAPWRKVS